MPRKRNNRKKIQAKKRAEAIALAKRQGKWEPEQKPENKIAHVHASSAAGMAAAGLLLSGVTTKWTREEEEASCAARSFVPPKGDSNG